MPLSIDEATRRYQSNAQNIQDSILIIESVMGSDNTFSFDLPKAIGHLETVDLLKEERAIRSQIKALEEYQKIITYEKKRRSLSEYINEKQSMSERKIKMKNLRRSERVSQDPYKQYRKMRQTATSIPVENVDVQMHEEK